MLRAGVIGLVVGLAVATGVSGCVADDAPSVALDPAGRGSRVEPPTTPRPPEHAPRTAPTEADVALARSFASFAARPGPATAAALPWAPRVWLGLGENLFRAERRSTLANPTTWAHDLDAYGRDGPLSALRTLRPHVRRGGPGTLRTSVGPHARCAAGTSRAPTYLRDARRISLQPARAESCLEWFAVDLYVDARGLVRGVTLELWEP